MFSTGKYAAANRAWPPGGSESLEILALFMHTKAEFAHTLHFHGHRG